MTNYDPSIQGKGYVLQLNRGMTSLMKNAGEFEKRHEAGRSMRTALFAKFRYSAKRMVKKERISSKGE